MTAIASHLKYFHGGRLTEHSRKQTGFAISLHPVPPLCDWFQVLELLSFGEIKKVGPWKLQLYEYYPTRTQDIHVEIIHTAKNRIAFSQQQNVAVCWGNVVFEQQKCYLCLADNVLLFPPLHFHDNHVKSTNIWKQHTPLVSCIPNQNMWTLDLPPFVISFPLSKDLEEPI